MLVRDRSESWLLKRAERIVAHRRFEGLHVTATLAAIRIVNVTATLTGLRMPGPMKR